MGLWPQPTTPFISSKNVIILLIFSIALAIYGYYNLNTNLLIPFTSFEIPLGILYIPFVVIIYAATTNAVNLTDGLDGHQYQF